MGAARVNFGRSLVPKEKMGIGAQFRDIVRPAPPLSFYKFFTIIYSPFACLLLAPGMFLDGS